MNQENGLGGITVHGVKASMPEAHSNGDLQNTASLYPKNEGEFRSPSDSFYLAMQRYSGGAEGNPPVSIIGNNKMSDVMRTSHAPSQAYYFELRDGRGDIITGVEKGKVAGEFIKTSDYGLSHTDRIVKIKEGHGIVILQRNTTGSDGEIIPDVVEEFEVKHVNEGQKVDVPRGFFYALVNTDRDSILVAQHTNHSKEDSSSKNPNSNALRRMGGFAYRIVAADSHVCLEPNKNYANKVGTFKNGRLPFFGQNLD